MEISIATITGIIILWFWLDRDKYKDHSKKNKNKNTNQRNNSSTSDKQQNPIKESMMHNNQSSISNNNNRGITNFYELENRILLMKDLLTHTNKISSEETGDALLNIFIKLFEKSKGSSMDSEELNKAIECLILIESFEINYNVKIALESIKSDIKEMAEISSMRTTAINRVNDIMDTSERKNNPQNLYEQVRGLAEPLVVSSYRRIAFQNGIAPTSKTSDDKIIEIYSKVGSAFKEVSKQRSEHIPAVYLNTIVLKFFQVYEMGGDMFFDEHLIYEANKYLREGLREDYKHELKLF